MGVLDGFTPEQQKIAMYGLPVVAGVALISVLKGKKKTGASEGSADPNQQVGGMGVLDLGQLSQFEGRFSDSLDFLWREFESVRARANTTPAAPAPTPEQPVATVPFAAMAAPPAPPPPLPEYVSPAPPIQLAPRQELPEATGIGQRYVTPDGYSFTYG